MRVLASLLLLGACVGAPPVAARASATDGWRRVEVLFEPPLAAPGELTVLHESGHEVRCRTGLAGVELLLPPGPAVLKLQADGGVWELPLTVGESALVAWRR